MPPGPALPDCCGVYSRGVDMGHKTDLRDLSKHSPRRRPAELWSDHPNMTQPQARQVTLNTIRADVDSELLSDNPPHAANLGDDVMRTQREFKYRMAKLQHCNGQPIRYAAGPDSDVIKTLRKMLKKQRRGIQTPAAIPT